MSVIDYTIAFVEWKGMCQVSFFIFMAVIDYMAALVEWKRLILWGSILDWFSVVSGLLDLHDSHSRQVFSCIRRPS